MKFRAKTVVAIECLQKRKAKIHEEVVDVQSRTRKAEEELKAVVAEYEGKNKGFTDDRLQLQHQIRHLKATLLGEGGRSDAGASELAACEAQRTKADSAYTHLNAYAQQARNFVARDADVELVGVFVFATADQQQLVEQFVSSVLLTQLDSTDGGLHLHVRVGRPEAARARSTFVVFAEPDNLVFGGWLDDINTCMADRSSSVCCMALGEGRALCDDGLFAIRCTQEGIQMVRDLRQRLATVEPRTLDSDRNVYAALNWGLKSLPRSEVKYLPIGTYRNLLGNDRLVTSYDARTMLKAYRATPPLGEAESPEVALEHLLRIRANVLEEKLAMTEIDVRSEVAVAYLPLLKTCIYSLKTVTPYTAGEDAMNAIMADDLAAVAEVQLQGRDRRSTLDKCRQWLPPTPSYSEKLDALVERWMKERYYSDPIPYGHPLQVPPAWSRVMPQLSRPRHAVDGSIAAQGDQMAMAEGPMEVWSQPGQATIDGVEDLGPEGGREHLLVNPLKLAGIRGEKSINPMLAFELMDAVDREARANGVPLGRSSRESACCIPVLGYILGVNAEDSTAVPAASTYLLPAKSGLVLSELRSLCSMCKLVRNDQRVCIPTQEANVSPLRKTLQHETYYYNDVMRHLFNEYPHAEVGLSRRRREPRDPVAAREIVALLLTDRTTDRDASHMQFIYQLLPVVANMIDLVGAIQTFSSRLMPAGLSCDAAERLMHASFVFDCPKLFRYICMHTATPIHRGVYDWPSLLYALLEQPDAQAYLSPLLTKMCRDEVALRVIDRIHTVGPSLKDLERVRSLDFLSKLAWGQPVHLRQSDLVYTKLPTIDQVGPLKNVKVVPIPKAQGPAEWWSGGVNIMRRKGKALNDGVPDIAAVT
ncbi:hypothetical protein Pmar_PMAR027946 [Perkinsus marinus ATCC 50983]|uniref:Uncharacterized protein n=1 Tax=Perkinsus marinus (strain ATCC 50983 / TXsc) TaxID=423536 RepID=C5LDH4_PERM5|nr:hypothetical protein Pmar_PMAR027946 [Perkinsus marinus ATCC 50983]EER05306.1 hypothetical protein Pmar_PMAR027946 [Perkinsus marinus ATCC 50983]|eukprot:XP_002773490.1 hypothetical protein Pmar_PMAR027946 [Perkinsus marinus ATCC 50983]